VVSVKVVVPGWPSMAAIKLVHAPMSAAAFTRKTLVSSEVHLSDRPLAVTGPTEASWRGVTGGAVTKALRKTLIVEAV
jgi:hypothetical protein